MRAQNNRTQIGGTIFRWGSRAYIMGILNVTPDSFSDGGAHNSVKDAVSHALRMASEGADLIDIGGESTRPTHTPVSAAEEIERVVPVLRAIREALPLMPLSIDTMKAEVANAAIAAGAHMVNDVWGFRRDPDMARITADAGVPCCLMHNRAEPEYEDLLKEVCADLMESVRLARMVGIPDDRILLDPGIGFGKTREQNLLLLRHLDRVRALGFPVLLGTSRKSVIGLTLQLPVEERMAGTLATTVLGLAMGADVIRVHDVRENTQACRMAEAILGAGEETWT